MRTFGIIEKLGGRSSVAEIISGNGSRTITNDTVRMWCARGRIPGYALKALISEAEKRKVVTSADDLDVITVNRSRRAPAEDAA